MMAVPWCFALPLSSSNVVSHLHLQGPCLVGCRPRHPKREGCSSSVSCDWHHGPSAFRHSILHNNIGWYVLSRQAAFLSIESLPGGQGPSVLGHSQASTPPWQSATWFRRTVAKRVRLRGMHHAVNAVRRRPIDSPWQAERVDHLLILNFIE